MEGPGREEGRKGEKEGGREVRERGKEGESERGREIQWNLCIKDMLGS